MLYEIELFSISCNLLQASLIPVSTVMLHCVCWAKHDIMK